MHWIVKYINNGNSYLRTSSSDISILSFNLPVDNIVFLPSIGKLVKRIFRRLLEFLNKSLLCPRILLGTRHILIFQQIPMDEMQIIRNLPYTILVYRSIPVYVYGRVRIIPHICLFIFLYERRKMACLRCCVCERAGGEGVWVVVLIKLDGTPTCS